MTTANRVFESLPGGGYVFLLLTEGVRLEVRHLRRRFHELHGEVDVQVEWSDALTDSAHSVTCADLKPATIIDGAGMARCESCDARQHGERAAYRGVVRREAARRALDELRANQ